MIPLVDIKEAHDRDVLQRIHEAFSEIGFVYIKHSLITKELVRTGSNFFNNSALNLMCCQCIC